METTTAVRSAGRTSAFAAPEVHAVATSDGTEIRLTRYATGTKGPIVLAPGYGNAARAFALESVPLSFTEYLGEHGYDVWLLDYRASADLPSSHTQFTLDDIAMRDWPAAIDRVRAETGAESVQVLGHCIGGMSLFMAIGGGMQGVRSAVFSALAGHPIPTPANRARAHLRMATIFKRLGLEGLDTRYDAQAALDRVIETAMRVLPVRRAYDSPVGRRIYFIYGDVFDHRRIDERVMRESVPSFFGNGNITFFEHASLAVRRGRAVDAQGRDAYWSHPERFRMPMTFLTGERNRMFLPKSLERTHERLCAANGPDLYERRVVPGYAHLDLWIGRDSARDVFPIALDALERQN